MTNDFFWSKLLVVLLVCSGIYFTIRSRFFQVTMFKHMFQLLRESSEKRTKEISSFQAFCISMAARVGTGNITGIAIAISLGGPGAVFWMWMTALIGSASGFVESTLAQVYKVKDKNGFRGGPAYYMELGLNKRWMGILFAVLITLSLGLIFNCVQSNTITVAWENSFGIDRFLLGCIVTLLFSCIIFGGVKRIARASEYIVVVMATVYIAIAFLIVLFNINKMPEVLYTIFKNAFGFEQIATGSLATVIVQGVKRGLFSNEAGMGSAPNAAATATTSHPVKQGLIQALGVLIDTLVICSSTAFIILLSNSYKQSNLEGIALAQAALSYHIGTWASGALAIMVFLFAFSTLIGNYYYGETNIEFLKSNRVVLYTYRFAVLGMILFGSVAKVKLVWDLADIFMGVMVVVNLIAILILFPVALAALQDYIQQKKEGKDPIFCKTSLGDVGKIECWENKSHQSSSSKE